MITTKKILFFSLFKIDSLEVQGIYPDLLGEFSKRDFELYILSPHERGSRIKNKVSKINNVNIIQVKTLKIQKTNKVEKLISSLSLEFLFILNYYKYLSKISFDLVIFPTPTIFVTNFLKRIKLSKNGIKYLLIKDIFPQNAIDLNFLKKNSFFTKMFQKIEKNLYENVDYIGCMSQANLLFLKDKKNIDLKKLEVNPNSVDLKKYPNLKENVFRKSKKISPKDLIFVYGGNLGKPQDVSKIIKFIELIESLSFSYFIICGTGTESKNIQNHIKKNNIKKTLLFTDLKKEEYLQVVKESNVGLVFLHDSFTIPNYPSRILDYMFYKLPVLSWTDKNTDIGNIFVDNNAGYSFQEKDSFPEIKSLIECMDFNELKSMGINSHKILIDKFQSKYSYNIIKDKLA